ncbi:glycoside hydrolase family 38 C-terminal domain-containing protein [Mucilaginibacter sp. X5P1]|uniref:glycoside hydrolase family 38 C-terminal domain-containing protein n=1 Tax=Mucilaginibacter sp. X5P1 TaxID=2723088 RepID=UPI00160AAC55|nr:glycoside hydrolase family 38 C-terminal domain-containing protein [Mucilaginibacter sp. X5P1]MBB6138701.1 alpha-mannosidase [Mucilaginibacter sp. X5P1]
MFRDKKIAVKGWFRFFGIIIFALIGFKQQVYAQTSYFIDGYHGGIWGHYPDWNTRFMADQLKLHPNWKINLEIEPETWDNAKVKDSAAYNDFRALFADQNSATARIEYVNPDYAQSYLFDIEGESIIRQFYYGIRMVKRHFPTAVFPAYSSEEPCFTSALPQILTSYGFKYASLKNPNTCWGGYTTAYGGELVNWVGPDGTKIITSPRYAVEALQPGSTWQTIAAYSTPEYVKACFAAGIKHPVGLTLQDAGWKQGPIIKDNNQSVVSTTWADYFENIAIKSTTDNWKFTQEDVLVSLVWGSQILQQIAQEVRVSENKLISAEKLATITKVYSGIPYSQTDFDAAWRPLLLSQHHDCWIVPYNGSKGNTWADKVVTWTSTTNRIADSVVNLDISASAKGKTVANTKFIRVYNTLGIARKEPVTVTIPVEWQSKAISVLTNAGRSIASQIVSDSTSSLPQIVFNADVPAMGYNTYQLKLQKAPAAKSLTVFILNNGDYKLESDLYTIILDPKKGGAIKSLIAKALNNKEFVDQANSRSFNELRGNFYNDGGFHSSAENPAVISIVEKGPERVKLQIKGTIDGSPFTQWLTVAQGQRRIDMQVKIDWKGNSGIGEYTEPGTFKFINNKKAFYNDKEKLLAMFPLNLKAQKVYKNAPFDVLQSRLKNTFFTRWDSIKNNVILNWVDVTDGNDSYGMALLTDHTTNYTHGEDFPLGLTLEYSGVGLWGRDYSITGPTNVHYALVPHAGKWDKSGIWTEGTKWNEPLIAKIMDAAPAANDLSRSMLNMKHTGYDITSLNADGNNITIRVFNAEGDNSPQKIAFDGTAKRAELIELNGQKREDLVIQKDIPGKTSVMVSMPRFGIRTIKLYAISNKDK